MGTRDMCQSVEGYIYKKIVVMFYSRTSQFLSYLMAHALCESPDAMAGNTETQDGQAEALSGQSEG